MMRYILLLGLVTSGLVGCGSQCADGVVTPGEICFSDSKSVFSTSPASFTPLGLSSANLDGDQRDDLIVTVHDGVLLLLNQGEEVFGFVRLDLPLLIPLPPGQDDWRVVAADVDLDGLDDLLIAAPTAIEVYLGNGDGTFRQGSTLVVESAQHVAGDFDADGDVDLAMIVREPDAWGTVTIFANDGASVFSALPSAYRSDQQLSRIIPVDFDADGDLDILLPGDCEDVLLVNAGDARFTEQQVSASGRRQGSTELADFDGDGVTDIVKAGPYVSTRCVAFGGSASGVTVYFNRGGGEFDGVIVSDGPGGRLMTSGDFDADGDSDLFLDNGEDFEVLPNLGDGTFYFPQEIPQKFGGPISLVHAVDLNDDGIADLVGVDRRSVYVAFSNP